MDGDADLDPIAFGTDGWRAPLPEFTEPRVRAVGRAVAAHLDDAGLAGPVLVGYDARERSPALAAALAEALAAAGREAVLATRDLPTPALAWGVRERDAAGALTITASHNPPSYNGVKLLGPAGAPALPEATDAVADRLGRCPSADGGRVVRADLIGPYLDDALAFVGCDLDGLVVAYDALHGSGRGVTDELLTRAGARVERRRCGRDPSFGGAAPNPSAETLDALAETVRAGEAALGLANDGDADRLVVVTPERGVLDGNATFALLYDHLLADATGPAVRTVSTTALIDRIAAAHGAATVETAVGFKWVAEAMAETDALVGGEESGGYAVRGRPRNKDGVLGALLVAAAAVEEPLDDRLDRIGDVHGRPATGKVSLDCPDDAKPAVLDDLADALPGTVAGRAVVDTTTTDGFKLALADGSWLLVRPSGTEPKLRLYAEADDDDRLAALLEAGRELVAPFIP